MAILTCVTEFEVISLGSNFINSPDPLTKNMVESSGLIQKSSVPWIKSF